MATTPKSHSLCFISNDLKHDVDFVHVVIRETVEFIKSFLFDDVVHIHYFSDGCAAQYKNLKNFINLCHHKIDFNVDCSWSFFATSHGKSPCDGIGGTLKRLAARASLQRAKTNQIVSPEDFFNFCNDEIKMVTSIYIPKEEIEATREKMRERYEKAKTVPGTRSFHHFVPLSHTPQVPSSYSKPRHQNMCNRFPSQCSNDGCQQVLPRNEVFNIVC